MTPFGLVLGGGGPIGAAWYAGLASGLADEGFDLGVADVIGTSAGAWAGVWLACERSTEFIDVMNRVAAGPEPLAMDTDLIAQVCALMGHAKPHSGRPTRNALANSPCLSRRSESASTRRTCPDRTWPERFHSLVVNIKTGELRVLGRADGLPLEVGVAASCAAAGLAPPVALPDGLFMDGGDRSAINADELILN